MHTKRPDAEALLTARLARGWQPTPTQTRDGPVILGFACKISGNKAPAP